MEPVIPFAALGPIACGTRAYRHRGRVVVGFIVKATFAMVHEEKARLVSPAPIASSEVHHHDNPSRSVRAPSEDAPYLRRADVIFAGHAHAVGAPRVDDEVRLAVLRVGTPLVDKWLVVRGDAGPSGPLPYTSLPVVYERAYGGPGFAANPIGAGLVAGSGQPNFVDLEGPLKPAGFGPISATWAARRGLLEGADRRGLAGPIVDLPDDFRWDYYQAAPVDQQCDYLAGDERIVLEGLHPRERYFETSLPGARAAAIVFGLPGLDAPGELAFHLDTLFVDGDALTCSAIWRALLPVADEASLDGLRAVAALELPGEAITWPRSADDVPELRGASRARAAPATQRANAGLGTGTLRIEDAPKAGAREVTVILGDALPSRPPTPFVPGPSALATPPPSRPAAAPAGFAGTFELSLDEEEDAAHRPATPFARAAPPSSGSAAASQGHAAPPPVAVLRAAPPATGAAASAGHGAASASAKTVEAEARASSAPKDRLARKLPKKR